MECKDVRSLADAYLSEQLLVETTQAVVAHLERCPACRAEFEGQRRLRVATRSAFENAPDLKARPAFLDQLAMQLLAQSAAKGTWPRWRPWLAIAAGLILVAGLGASGVAWVASARLLALGLRAAGDHQKCAIKFRLDEHPIPLAEAADKYDKAFGRLNVVEPGVTNLSAGNVRVLERHACVYDGQPFAHIVLSYRDTAVSILVAGEGGLGNDWWGKGSTRSLPQAGGFNVASFRSAGHRVFVVSSLEATDVDELAQVMTRPIAAALAGL